MDQGDDAAWLPTPPTAKEEAGFPAADEAHHRAFESQWIGSETQSLERCLSKCGVLGWGTLDHAGFVWVPVDKEVHRLAAVQHSGSQRANNSQGLAGFQHDNVQPGARKLHVSRDL
jgi:hypothetical protein